MPDFPRPLSRLSPPTLAFLGSLLLSLLAVSGTIIVGRDAGLYLHVAQQAVDQGPRVAYQLFNWPWFSFLLAGTHWLLGLPLELIATLWCAGFMAGTCALLVAVTQRFAVGSGYWACLVVWSLPAFNQFRDDIIREQGFWFFCILALSLALRWLERSGWWRAASVQLAIACAALFRLEAVLLLPVLCLCLLTELPARRGWLMLLQLNALPLAAGLVGLIGLLAGEGSSQPRVAFYLEMLDPRKLEAQFDLMANRFATVALEKYSVKDAREIIFYGLSLTLLMKFFALNGPFSLPLLYRASWRGLRDYWRALKPFAWSWLLYFCVLMVFFVQQRFINSRYVSFLNLLAVPFLTVAAMLFFRRFPRWSRLFMVLVTFVTLHNVVSFGAKKTHYLEAAGWVSQHTQPADAIFYADSRIAYYAGRGFPRPDVTAEQVLAAGQGQEFRYLVLTTKPDDPALQHWLAAQQKRILSQFANRKGETVLIIGD